MAATKIWMAGMTCLVCGEGKYLGYANPERVSLTTPCTKCGDIQPGWMPSTLFEARVKLRDSTPLPVLV